MCKISMLHLLHLSKLYTACPWWFSLQHMNHIDDDFIIWLWIIIYIHVNIYTYILNSKCKFCVLLTNVRVHFPLYWGVIFVSWLIHIFAHKSLSSAVSWLFFLYLYVLWSCRCYRIPRKCSKIINFQFLKILDRLSQ